MNLIIRPVWSILEIPSPKIASALKPVLAYQPDGYQHAHKYQAGAWDGFDRLYRHRMEGLYFPTGMVPQVLSQLKRKGHQTSIVNERYRPTKTIAQPAYELDGITLRDYQQQMVDAITQPPQQDSMPFRLSNDQAEWLETDIGMPTALRLPGMGIWWSATGSGKTEAAAALIAKLGVKSLFLVYGKNLVQQTFNRFKSRLSKWLLENDLSLGIAIEGRWDPGDVTVASTSTLDKILKRKNDDSDRLLQWLQQVDLLILDEAHGAAAKNVYEMAQQVPAYYRVAMSGTPVQRADGANLKVLANFGEVVHRSTNKQMKEAGVIPDATIRLVAIHGKVRMFPDYRWHDLYNKGIVFYDSRNRKIIEIIQEHYNQGHKILVIFKAIDHGTILSNMLWSQPDRNGDATFIPHEIVQPPFPIFPYDPIPQPYRTPQVDHHKVDGADKLKDREAAIEQFRAGQPPVLLASEIFSTGIDIPEVDVLVNAAGGKAVIPVLQRLGRGLRGKSHLFVYDFADTQYHTLAKHALARLMIYKKEGCFTIQPM